MSGFVSHRELRPAPRRAGAGLGRHPSESGRSRIPWSRPAGDAGCEAGGHARPLASSW